MISLTDKGAEKVQEFLAAQAVVALTAGLRVGAWQYVYGAEPVTEAEVGAVAVRVGADCLVIDAEAEYEGRYVQAQQYLGALRARIGSRYPLALAGLPYPLDPEPPAIATLPLRNARRLTCAAGLQRGFIRQVSGVWP